MDPITLVLAGLGLAPSLIRFIKFLLNPENRSKFIAKLQSAIFSLLSDEEELKACKKEVAATQEMMQRYYDTKNQAINDTIERLGKLCNELAQSISKVQECTQLLNNEFQRLSDLEEKKFKKDSRIFSTMRSDAIAAHSFVKGSQLLMYATRSKTLPESENPLEEAIEELTSPVKKNAQEKIQEAQDLLNQNTYIIEVNKYYASLDSQNNEQRENLVSKESENETRRIKLSKKVVIIISSVLSMLASIAAIVEGWNAFCTRKPTSVICRGTSINGSESIAKSSSLLDKAV